MPWIQTTIDGHPVEAWEPLHRDRDEAILLLHDLDAVAPSQRPDWCPLIEASPIPVICPLAGRSWWLSLPTSDFPVGGPLGWVATDVVAWVKQRWQISPPRIGVLGIGMGGHGALNLAYRHARQFPVVAAISAAVDFHVYQASEPVLQEVFDSVEAARQETATLHLHPLNWPIHQRIACHPNDPHWFEGCERLASKLDSSGIPFERDFRGTTSGGRMEFDREQLASSLVEITEKLPLAARQLETR